MAEKLVKVFRQNSMTKKKTLYLAKYNLSILEGISWAKIQSEKSVKALYVAKYFWQKKTRLRSGRDTIERGRSWLRSGRDTMGGDTRGKGFGREYWAWKKKLRFRQGTLGGDERRLRLGRDTTGEKRGRFRAK